MQLIDQKRNRFWVDVLFFFFFFFIIRMKLKGGECKWLKILFPLPLLCLTICISNSYVTLVLLPRLSYTLMNKITKKCALYRRAQKSFISEFLQRETERKKKAQSAAQLKRICGMLCKSQRKNSLSQAAVTIYFQLASYLCSFWEMRNVSLNSSIALCHWESFLYECKSWFIGLAHQSWIATASFHTIN